MNNQFESDQSKIKYHPTNIVMVVNCIRIYVLLNNQTSCLLDFLRGAQTLQHLSAHCVDLAACCFTFLFQFLAAQGSCVLPTNNQTAEKIAGYSVSIVKH